MMRAKRRLPSIAADGYCGPVKLGNKQCGLATVLGSTE